MLLVDENAEVSTDKNELNNTMLNDSMLDNSMVQLNATDQDQTNDLNDLIDDLPRVKGQTYQKPLALLSLRDNQLNYINMKKLKNKLLEGAQIRKLDLSDNLLQDKGAKYLCEYFANNSTVEQLIVNNNALTEVGALRLTDMFKLCKNLKVVSVAGNE